MKRLIYLLAISMMCGFLVGCSTSRKAAQSAAEQHISSTKSEDRHIEHKDGESVSSKQTVNDITNAVIEFTKTEYNDGTFETDITTPSPTSNTDNVDLEKKDPPNPNKGVKSVTTGRITLNNERTENNETEVKKSSETLSDESNLEDSAEDNTTEEKTEEKPTRGFIYYFGAITGAVIIAYVVYWLRRVIKRKKNA